MIGYFIEFLARGVVVYACDDTGGMGNALASFTTSDEGYKFIESHSQIQIEKRNVS